MKKLKLFLTLFLLASLFTGCMLGGSGKPDLGGLTELFPKDEVRELTPEEKEAQRKNEEERRAEEIKRKRELCYSTNYVDCGIISARWELHYNTDYNELYEGTTAPNITIVNIPIDASSVSFAEGEEPDDVWYGNTIFHCEPDIEIWEDRGQKNIFINVYYGGNSELKIIDKSQPHFSNDNFQMNGTDIKIAIPEGKGVRFVLDIEFLNPSLQETNNHKFRREYRIY